MNTELETIFSQNRVMQPPTMSSWKHIKTDTVKIIRKRNWRSLRSFLQELFWTDGSDGVIRNYSISGVGSD